MVKGFYFIELEEVQIKCVCIPSKEGRAIYVAGYIVV